MTDKIEFSIIKNFGPSVLKTKIPSKILVQLNDYVDEIILNEQKSKNLNYGPKLVGDVTQEFKLDQEFMKKIGWGDFLALCASKWIEIETQEKISKFQIINSWIVRQFKNEYNPTHWHSGHISGAGFLKIPSSFGSFKQQKDREYRGGNLQLIHGAKMFMCHSTINIVPQVGDFYFFPNYMMHTVFPFKDCDEERRSISFNAVIDEKIYNDYS